LFAVLLSDDVHQVVGVVIPLKVQQLLPIVLVLHFAGCEKKCTTLILLYRQIKQFIFEIQPFKIDDR
jgi:hypothetical protein